MIIIYLILSLKRNNDPLPSLYWWAVSVGGKNGVSQGTIIYATSKDLILVHTIQLKTMIIVHFSGKLVFNGISDVRKPSEEVDKTMTMM